jgi:hypothetical protein
MDDSIILKQVSSLPKSVQDFIYSYVWEDRVSEISKKYSLNQEQNESLSNIVLLALTMVIEPSTIKEVIVEDLSVSDLLAEQISSDLESRVFEYALKQIEGDSKTSDRTTSNEKLMSSGTQLELKPDNLPVVEANEPLRVNLVSSFVPTKPAFQNEVLDKQAPIGVPRYAEEVPKTPTVNPILEKKLGGNVGSNSAPIKYEKDPYREPIN